LTTKNSEDTKYLAKINQGNACGTRIVVCDIDTLKVTNDTLGHKAGNFLILQLADILKKVLQRDR
jgi:GGDEF domain-containing protein